MADIDWGAVAKNQSPAHESVSANIDWRALAKKQDRSLGKLVDKAAKPIGSAIDYGHKQPLEAVMNVLGAPQRGLQAAELGRFGDVGKAIMTPKMEPELAKAVKQKIGLQHLEDTALAGNDLGHKVARGALDFGLDLVNDPLNVLPVGKLAKLAGKAAKAVPGAVRAGEAIAEGPLGKTASYLFNEDHYLRGLSPEAKARFELGTNKAMEGVKARKVAEDVLVRKHANEIRAGKMPEEIQRLFQLDATGKRLTGPADNWKQYFLDKESGQLKFGKGTTPQDVQRALYRHRAPAFEQAVREHNEHIFFKHPSSYTDSSVYAVKPGVTDLERQEIIKATQDRLARAIEHKPDPEGAKRSFANAAKWLTRRGNQAFLANPLPHAFNLTNLAFNRYGLPTALEGIGNAARVATGTVGKGKLAQGISDLEHLGAHSQYGNLYDELGLTRLFGIPGTEGAAQAANKVIVPAERAINAAQNKILNSTETGLRAAALKTERKAGRSDPQAVKNIHSTFGTGAPNTLTMGASAIGAPFAKFHLQTAPGSALRTLALHPGRFAAPLKAQRDINAQVNPHGPNYVPTTPTFSGAKALADPLSYFSNLGPLSSLHSPFGTIEQLKKGPSGVARVIGDTAGKYVPGSEELKPLRDMLLGKRGRAGEQSINDLISAIIGGYYAKK